MRSARASQVEHINGNALYSPDRAFERALRHMREAKLAKAMGKLEAVVREGRAEDQRKDDFEEEIARRVQVRGRCNSPVLGRAWWCAWKGLQCSGWALWC